MGLIASPLGGLVLAIAGFVLLAISMIWGLSSAHSDRRPHLSAALTTAAVVFGLNMLARASGVWQWYGYGLPLVQQFGMLFAVPTVLFTLILAGYRWLGARTRRPGLMYGLIAGLLLIPVTVAGDLYTMRRGTLSFGKGYTIFHDIILGQALVWLPVILYVSYRRILGGLVTR